MSGYGDYYKKTRAESSEAFKRYREEITNWENQRGELEARGLLVRDEFEKELEVNRLKFKDRQGILGEPEHALLGTVIEHTTRKGKQFKLYQLKSGHIVLGNIEEGNYVVPPWLEEIYNQMKTVILEETRKKGERVEIDGRVYIVTESDVVTAAEAADMEDANDIFDAAGPYSRLVPVDQILA